MADPIRLNLGSGAAPLDGYDNLDLKNGDAAFPLTQYKDGSVDEVRASHLLEHFVAAGTQMVLKEWVRVLKPGGLLKIAVPDFEVISKKYQDGERGQYQGWVHGGQTDTNDVHFRLFDFDTLSDELRAAGLVGVHMWGGLGEQDPDCSSLEVSLNLAAYKRPEKWPQTHAAMSRPRLGFQDHFGCALDALTPLGIPLWSNSGAYWGRVLAKTIVEAMAAGAEYVLTMDYDTLFSKSDVEDLLAFMAANPEADALVPAQMGRNKDALLMNFKPAPGQTGLTFDDLQKTYIPLISGHFGLTLIRVSALKKMDKPWFVHTYKPDGSPEYDEDINFWLNMERNGLKAFLVPRVVVGHIEMVSFWPDRKLKLLQQRITDFNDNGKPRNVWR